MKSAESRVHMRFQDKLKDINRHTPEDSFQFERVVLKYCKAQKHLKKLRCNQRVPWTDRLSATEGTQKNSRLLLQAIQSLSRSPVHFYFSSTWIKKFMETSTKMKVTCFLTISGRKSMKKIPS